MQSRQVRTNQNWVVVFTATTPWRRPSAVLVRPPLDAIAVSAASNDAKRDGLRAGLSFIRVEGIIFMAAYRKELGPAPLMHGFTLHDVAVSETITIRAATAGEGPPLLLLHGYPQTHVTWRKIAPRLAAHFSVVACDLRGDVFGLLHRLLFCSRS